MVRDSIRLEALCVDVAALRRRGVDHHVIDASLPVPWLSHALRQTDAEVELPAHTSLRLLLQPEGVIVVQGTLQLRFSVPCGRCLAPADVNGDTELIATFMPAAAATLFHSRAGEDEEDAELDDELPDIWAYEGSTLDLDRMLAEYVALAYPMRALCGRADACRGLCSNCGYELNELDPSVLVCPGCHREVPLTPVATEHPTSDGDSREARPDEGPLAAALRKIKLD